MSLSKYQLSDRMKKNKLGSKRKGNAFEHCQGQS